MKPRTRHPSTLIPDDVVEDLNFRLYLMRLEPPMTVAQSAERRYEKFDRNGKPLIDKSGNPVIDDDASRRRGAAGYLSLTRAYLRVATDMGLIARCWPDGLGDRGA
jgi:hypothetical protein